MSKYSITASPETLLDHASMTVRQYFVAAIKAIDHEFGDGYAKEHPELVAAFIHCAGVDFSASIIMANMQDFVESLCSAIREAGSRSD
jgi:hypothetical protein